MSKVSLTFEDKDDGDVTIDADFDRDVTDEAVELSGAERVAAGILYRLYNDPETWLSKEDDTE